MDNVFRRNVGHYYSALHTVVIGYNISRYTGTYFYNYIQRVKQMELQGHARIRSKIRSFFQDETFAMQKKQCVNSLKKFILAHFPVWVIKQHCHRVFIWQVSKRLCLKGSVFIG